MRFSRGDNSEDGSGPTVLGIWLRLPVQGGVEDVKFVPARTGMLRRVPTTANSFLEGPFSTVTPMGVGGRRLRKNIV